jgi:hypothetical protein
MSWAPSVGRLVQTILRVKRKVRNKTITIRLRVAHAVFAQQ